MGRHRNGGVRKICRCGRTRWSKCRHPWHFSFFHAGKAYRFSLDRVLGQRVESWTDANTEADRLRTLIRAGTFRLGQPVNPLPDRLTFAGYTDIWLRRDGGRLVGLRDHKYRLEKIKAFVLPGTTPPLTFGDKALAGITTDDVELYRDSRRALGLAASTLNHDLKLLRRMFSWAVRKGYRTTTPFKVGTEPAITLDREIPRHFRFAAEEDEKKLLNAANPHLRALIIGMLDTACRPGELLSLQWKDVSMERRELVVRAEKSKTRTARIIPVSKRLLAVLEMGRLDPAGREFTPEHFVFGDALGERVKSVRTAWANAIKRAGLGDVQLRDLRHESGSRFDEAGVPINYVSKLLGHASLVTTTRYLNIQRRELHRAVAQLEERFANRLQDPESKPSTPAVEDGEPNSPKPTVS